MRTSKKSRYANRIFLTAIKNKSKFYELFSKKYLSRSPEALSGLCSSLIGTSL